MPKRGKEQLLLPAPKKWPTKERKTAWVVNKDGQRVQVFYVVTKD